METGYLPKCLMLAERAFPDSLTMASLQDGDAAQLCRQEFNHPRRNEYYEFHTPSENESRS